MRAKPPYEPVYLSVKVAAEITCTSESYIEQKFLQSGLVPTFKEQDASRNAVKRFRASDFWLAWERLFGVPREPKTEDPKTA